MSEDELQAEGNDRKQPCTGDDLLRISTLMSELQGTYRDFIRRLGDDEFAGFVKVEGKVSAIKGIGFIEKWMRNFRSAYLHEIAKGSTGNPKIDKPLTTAIEAKKAGKSGKK